MRTATEISVAAAAGREPAGQRRRLRRCEDASTQRPVRPFVPTSTAFGLLARGVWLSWKLIRKRAFEPQLDSAM